MSAHAFINVVIPFEPKHSAAVNAALRAQTDTARGNQPAGEIEQALAATGIVHFMSITVVEPKCPAEPDDAPVPPGNAHLMLEISADGGAGEALTVIAHEMGPQLERLLQAAGITVGNESLGTYLIRHHREIGATWGSDALGQVFAGSPGMSVKRILREEKLARYIGELTHGYRAKAPWHESSPRQRLETVRNRLWDAGGWKWAFVPEAAPCLAGDPHNPWDDRLVPSNRQVWKAGLTIIWDLLAPIFSIFGLVFFGVLVYYLLAGKVDLSLNIGAWARMADVALLWTAWGIAGLLVGLVAGLVLLFGATYGLARLAWIAAGVLGLLLLVLLVWIAQVFAGLALALIAGLVVFFVIAWLRLARLERTDVVEDRTPLAPRVAELMKVENNRERAQNHLASVSRLKGGLLRRLTLRLAFVVVGTGRFVCAPGFLGKNGVIHFARWMRLPGTDQLLFWSNYDGTWESYVADFIADAPTGVTAIWSNCFGFPRSSALFGRGATDRDRLVRWARRQQHPTTFWYSAYPYLTADRIRINAAIRQGLASAESDADARDWLDLFGSKTRPPDALQVSQVPTLVFGGLPRLRHATCLAIQFDSRSTLPERRHWLATAARHASYGEMLPGQQAAVVVAFSATGLKALGLDEDTIATFPVPFQEGMWPEWRARALGDFDDNAPKYWDWGDGNRREQVDVLVLVYARGPEELTNQTTQVKPPNGIARVLRAIPLKLDIPAGARYPEELFGFADGVSQPVIAGTPRSRTRTSPNDLVAPGEIVLGYPDNLSRSLNLNVIPPSPSVSGRDDPEHMLQDVGPDPFRRRPEFSRYEGTGRRDLGANGTFLVVRQLEQDKKALDQWLEEAVDSIKHEVIVATEGSGDGKGRTAVLWGNRDLEKETQGPLARTRLLACQQIDWTDQDLRKKIKNYISAKLVGRWQDGTSLVRHPLLPGSEDSPPAHPDNAFLLGAEDPTGLACPFGAHIRRANPRDTRFPGSSEEIATTNRHRILRVGRTYRMPDQAAAGAGGQSGAGNTKEGLLFMCLNADIERQFEFVQKTWIMNPNLHGLENEDDPLLGRGSTTFTVPTPTGSVVLKGLGKFVTMKGGGYFFIPGRAVLRYLMR